MNLLGSVDCLRGKPSGPALLRIAARCSLVAWAIVVTAAIGVMLPEIINTTNVRGRSEMAEAGHWPTRGAVQRW